MPRHEFSKKTKRDAWDRADGHCEMVWDGERCGAEVYAGNVEYDHIIEDARGGDNSLENCCVSCIPCHKAKTKKNRPAVDKTRRQYLKNIGAWPKSRARIQSRPFQNTRPEA